MQIKDTARYFRVKAVAEMFDVSPSTIYRAVEAGELDAIRIGGTVRIPAHAVRAFEDKSGQAAYDAFVVNGQPAARNDAVEGEI